MIVCHNGLLTATDSWTNVHCGNMFLVIMAEEPANNYICELLAFVFTLSRWAIYGYLKYVCLKFMWGSLFSSIVHLVGFFFNVKTTLWQHCQLFISLLSMMWSPCVPTLCQSVSLSWHIYMPWIVTSSGRRINHKYEQGFKRA